MCEQVLLLHCWSQVIEMVKEESLARSRGMGGGERGGAIDHWELFLHSETCQVFFALPYRTRGTRREGR